MKNNVYILFLLLAGCTFHLTDENVKMFPPSKTTMMVRQASYVSNTASELVFDVDLYHVIGYNYDHPISTYFYNDLYYDTKFNTPAGGKFNLLDSSEFTGPSVVPSATVILVDESGSYDSLDYYNNRSQGLTKLCQDFTSPSQFLIGGFSKDGSLSSPVLFYTTSFATYTKEMMPFIFDLAKMTGGKSNLYDAVSLSIDKVNETSGVLKNIVVLAHANDEVSSIGIDSLVAKATVNKVQVHIIFLGKDSEANALAKLSLATGGTYIVCPTSGEMMCSFENLYSVLNAGGDIYQRRLHFQPTSGAISSGQEFWFTFTTYNTYLNVDENSMVVYIKVP